jgi:hypothetical protein
MLIKFYKLDVCFLVYRHSWTWNFLSFCIFFRLVKQWNTLVIILFLYYDELLSLVIYIDHLIMMHNVGQWDRGGGAGGLVLVKRRVHKLLLRKHMLQFTCTNFLLSCYSLCVYVMAIGFICSSGMVLKSGSICSCVVRSKYCYEMASYLLIPVPVDTCLTE